ncbi:PTS system mannose-specific EIIAB component [Clostridium puniceum]|uniref:PTS system mannose-specific EIIAB component n=1 Tax=Clostridium puniceum TaxID=29367 RepID=A0A1S8TX13_9CLOT|nr:hypothetical protein [Clostridium puniceum]OOM82261.1 PTS system mannose-specific EIIAB component [Clostridium puniceum]
MTKIILISHGELSEAMAKSAQMITGERSNLFYYGLYPGQHPSEIINNIKNEAKNNEGNDFIVIADIFGGSVCNAAMELVEFSNIKLISGMNLSLVIEVLLEMDTSDEELNEKINNAKDGIKLFSNTENIKQIQDKNDFF